MTALHQHFSVHAVADRLAVADSTVRALIRSGQLRAVRVGRLVRIPGEALDVYLDASGITPPPAPTVAPSKSSWRARWAAP
jgi:excisionase family DNA binding protein